jgi:hypothetical protein
MEKQLNREIGQAVTAGIIELAKNSELAAQQADLLEEADRVNPRLMQATDEQIEAEVARRANFPAKKAWEVRNKILDHKGDKLMLDAMLAEYAAHVRADVLQAQQEGGSHE